ncbi:response regulator [Paraburkholderia sp.]|uniref:response regulator n=1 Tax=Paraburkholderia sp. TaxID=1926495 RepID=UPI002396638F|nr:response regulator [Paraburkholderia sp.]MDE1179121.1 response regulator [Paraburkholderia sp.]
MALVLLVEDDANLLRALETLVSTDGHAVRTAVNGVDALSVARAERPDVVVSDCMMPLMDGVELLREMKSMPALQAIPFVMTSAIASAPNASVYAFLRKPFPAKELLRVIRRALSS